MQERELVIVGGGPAGFTAAIYAKRAGLNSILFEKKAYGGQINTTSEVENWPGQIMIGGTELGASFRQHAEHLGCEIAQADVREIIPENNAFLIQTSLGEIKSKAVIIASGAVFRHLGCDGEARLTGMGVSYCAVCDGAFFEGEEIAVIGGGNTAVEEAAYLTRFASKVHIIHRRDEFRADHLVTQRVLANPKIVPVWDTVVEAINGQDAVEGLTLKNVKTGQISNLPVAGVFVFVGTVPVSRLVADLLETAPGGWIKTDQDMRTSLPGLFAAGDVRDTGLRQVVTAAGDGARAAMSAHHYITGF